MFSSIALCYMIFCYIIFYHTLSHKTYLCMSLVLYFHMKSELPSSDLRPQGSFDCRVWGSSLVGPAPRQGLVCVYIYIWYPPPVIYLFWGRFRKCLGFRAELGQSALLYCRSKFMALRRLFGQGCWRPYCCF